MITKTADKTKYVEIVQGKHIIIERAEDGPVHLDGEPQMMGRHAEINIVPHSLKIITGRSFGSH